MKIVITVKDTDNVIGLKEDIAMRLEGVADIVRIDTADVVPKSEVEKIFAEMEKLVIKIRYDADYSIFDMQKDFAKLKKKYTVLR